MSATGVLETSRSAAAQLESEIREALGPDARLGPWRVRYWSFLRRARCRADAGASRALWLKVPKRDPACRDLSRVLLDPEERAAAAREARAHRDLERAFRGEADLGFVRLVDFRPSSSLLVTEDAEIPHLAPVLRRAARRPRPDDERHAHEALRRAGRFLRIAHARIPVDAAVRRDELAAQAIARFEAHAHAAGIRRDLEPAREALREAYAGTMPLVAAHRGVDVRNVLDDGTRQVWLDPHERFDDLAAVDLARMVATLAILDYGSASGLMRPRLRESWVEALLDGYERPAWLSLRTLAVFTLAALLDRFDDALRIVAIQTWPRLARRTAEALYTRRFYNALVGDALAAAVRP